MVSKKSGKSRTLGIAAITLAVLIIVSSLGFFAYVNSTGQPSPKDKSVKPAGETVTIKGMILCLPHKDTTGPQTMECAYGLKDESGTYYGLSDSDAEYGNISRAPMNEKAVVTGTLEKKSSTKYPTVGTITVTNISR